MTQKTRTVVITGGTGGIGLETAKALARGNWRVIVTGRDPKRADQAMNELRRLGSAHAIALTGDVSTRTGVAQLAADIAARAPVLDVLIHNAGALDGTRHVTADGLERMLAVNHAAPWLLTHALLANLHAAQAARVIILTTSGHRFGQFRADDPEPRKRFVGLGSYADSKLLNLLTMFGWADELRRQGISVFAADPGGAATSMTDAMRAEYVPWPMRAFWPLMRASFGRKAPEASRIAAAQSSVVAATDPALEGQTAVYIGPKGKPVAPSRTVRSAQNRKDALAQTRRLLPPLASRPHLKETA